MDAQFPHTGKDLSGGAKHKDLANLVYLLQAIAVFTALPFFIAVIINYVKRQDVSGTLSESHFRWQIRTFWYSLLWGLLGALLIFLLVGYLILFINYCWIIYRIIRGWIRLNDNKAMYD